MLTLFFLFCEWFESCLVNLHGVIIRCWHHMFGLQYGWCELLQCWWQFPMFLLLTFKKLIITTHILRDCLTQGQGIRHGQPKVLHISMESKLKLVHERSLLPRNVTCQLLISEVYIEVRCVPWRRAHNLFVVIHSLSELPKEAPNSSKNASKLFKRRNWRSRKGANHVKVVPNNKVPMNPTSVRSSE